LAYLRLKAERPRLKKLATSGARSSGNSTGLYRDIQRLQHLTYRGNRLDLQWICHSYSLYMLRNRRLIKTLVDNHIDYLLYDSFFEAMDSCECFLHDIDPCTRSYAASFYAGGFACVARRYAEEGCASSADQLEKLLRSLLSGRLL
jgi:hypothetical protein